MERQAQYAECAKQFAAARKAMLGTKRIELRHQTITAPVAAVPEATPNPMEAARRAHPELVQQLEANRVALKFARALNRIPGHEGEAESFLADLARIDGSDMSRGEKVLRRAELFAKGAVVLGPEGYSDVEATLKAAPVLDALSAELNNRGAPLSNEQADLLTEVIAAQVNAPGQWEAIDWPAVVSALQSTLNHEQLAALQSVQAQAEFAAEFYRRTGQRIDLHRMPLPHY